MTRIEIKTRAKAQLGNNIFSQPWLMALLACLIVSVVSGILGSIPVVGAAITLIISGPLSFALAYIFLKQSRDGQPINFEDLLIGFKNDFAQNLLLGLLSSIFIALWSMLFVIPGIVKSYSYSMIYYIKADHPEYNWQQCLTESRRIMNGKKMDLFIQDLSFLGWMFVGSLACGIGTLWVAPYMNASRAYFYESVKNSNAVVGF